MQFVNIINTQSSFLRLWRSTEICGHSLFLGVAWKPGKEPEGGLKFWRLRESKAGALVMFSWLYRCGHRMVEKQGDRTM